MAATWDIKRYIRYQAAAAAARFVTAAMGLHFPTKLHE